MLPYNQCISANLLQSVSASISGSGSLKTKKGTFLVSLRAWKSFDYCRQPLGEPLQQVPLQSFQAGFSQCWAGQWSPPQGLDWIYYLLLDSVWPVLQCLEQISHQLVLSWLYAHTHNCYQVWTITCCTHTLCTWIIFSLITWKSTALIMLKHSCTAAAKNLVVVCCCCLFVYYSDMFQGMNT